MLEIDENEEKFEYSGSVTEASEHGHGTESLKRMRNKLSALFDECRDPFTATKLADRIAALTEQIGDGEKVAKKVNESKTSKYRKRASQRKGNTN